MDNAYQSLWVVCRWLQMLPEVMTHLTLTPNLGDACTVGSATVFSGKLTRTSDDSVCSICGVSHSACRANIWSAWHHQCSTDPTSTVHNSGPVSTDTTPDIHFSPDSPTITNKHFVTCIEWVEWSRVYMFHSIAFSWKSQAHSMWIGVHCHSLRLQKAHSN